MSRWRFGRGESDAGKKGDLSASAQSQVALPTSRSGGSALVFVYAILTMWLGRRDRRPQVSDQRHRGTVALYLVTAMTRSAPVTSCHGLSR